MLTGWLWFDNNPKSSLKDKVLKALDYYTNKYGKHSGIVYVHPSMVPAEPLVTGIEIRSSKQVLPNHFFVVDKIIEKGE